jgi:hypothetical protein
LLLLLLLLLQLLQLLLLLLQCLRSRLCRQLPLWFQLLLRI